MADDIAKKRAALNVGNLIKDTGFVQGPSLSSIFAEYAASLPETTAKNAIAMNDMVQNSMPYNFDPRSNGINPNYDPQAAKEFANYIPNLMGATAWHGTPHNIKGAFDLAKVGTGEGAQVYGHGMYFAQNPKVAIEYQNKVKNKENIKALQDQILDLRAKQQKATTREEADKLLNAQNTLIEQRNAIENHPGNLYKVDVPDEHIPKMLDWDKPISEQPHVWNALPQDVKNAIDDLLESKHVNTMSDVPEGYTGKHLYSMLKHPEVHDTLPAEVPNSNWYKGDTTNEKHVSQYLNSLGIPGIKYLDAGSRTNVPTIRKTNHFNQDTKELTESWQVNPNWNAPNQIKHFPTKEEAQAYADSFSTHNFVSFDPAAVKILEKNNEPIEFAMGGSVQHMAEGNQPDPIPIQKNNPMVEQAANKALIEIAKRKALYEIGQIAEQERSKQAASRARPNSLYPATGTLEPSGNGGPMLNNPLNR